jgi:two-component system response regulator NreC
MINITIITRHENDRKTIVTLLSEQDDIHITCIGKDGYDALRSAMLHRPDIIIMDFNMGDIISPDLAPILKRNSPSTSLIVLCSHDECSTVNKVLDAGISGYLLREEGFNNLAATVRSVFYGGLYISKTVRDQMFNYFSVQPDRRTKKEVFSPTEMQIFYGIIYGQTDKEIAKDLNIVTGSLRNSVNRIKKKTGLHNRTQIAIYALFAGIINIEKIKEKIFIYPN